MKVIITTALTALLLGACSASVDGNAAPPPPSSPSAAEVQTETQTQEPVPEDLQTTTEELGNDAEPTPEATPSDEAQDTEIIVKFGGSAVWKNGLQLSVSTPRSFTPSDTASGGGKNNVVHTVKLTNKTGKTYDPSLISIVASDAVGDLEEIFDSAKDINGRPDAKLRNGRSTTWKIAFTLNGKSMKSLSVQVQPQSENYDESYRLAIFEQ